MLNAVTPSLKPGTGTTIRKYVDGVRYNGNLIYFSNEWYGINKTSRLYTCTAVRVGYTVA